MVALAFIDYIFRVFIKKAVAFVGKRGAVTFIGEAVTSIEEAVAFVGEGGSAVKRLFKTARVKVDDVKGVNKCNLKQRLIIYELKGPLLLTYS